MSASSSPTWRPSQACRDVYNQRDTAKQWIYGSMGGKGAIEWTRLSCRLFAANAVRLQLHALAYNLGNFLRTLATPEAIKDRSFTSLRDHAFEGKRSGELLLDEHETGRPDSRWRTSPPLASKPRHQASAPSVKLGKRQSGGEKLGHLGNRLRPGRPHDACIHALVTLCDRRRRRRTIGRCPRTSAS